MDTYDTYDKYDIYDICYANTDKNPKSLYIIGIVIAVLFIIITIVFKIFFIPQNYHKISIVNNCAYDINVLFGAQASENKNNITYFPFNTIASGTTITYKASPGTILTIKGYRIGASTNNIGAFTSVNLKLSNYNFSNNQTIIDNNNNSIKDLYTYDDINNVYDIYAVSIQQGYNIPLTINPTSNVEKSNGNYCSGPVWKKTLDSCPDDLKFPNAKSYEYCSTPCYATTTDIADKDNYCCSFIGACDTPDTCENAWSNQSYYQYFSNVCPNCLITNCDEPNYKCKSSNGLSNYTLTFCPT
jgi:hypothetical protein